jgi:surface antigen
LVAVLSGSDCVGLVTPAAAAKSCTASATPTPNKYNRTPAGDGPWQVPLDPCNYEARANGYRAVNYDDCVYWVAEKRPDVFYGPVNRYGYKVAPYGAWNVAVDAKKGGYAVDKFPRVGDIAAWKGNAMMGQTDDGYNWFQASPGGHVSYVEGVDGDVITLSETGHGEDWGGYTFDLRYTPATYFIHRR